MGKPSRWGADGREFRNRFPREALPALRTGHITREEMLGHEKLLIAWPASSNVCFGAAPERSRIVG